MNDRTASASSQAVGIREDTAMILAQLESQKAKYGESLPGRIRFEDFRDVFKVAVQRNPRLLQADRASLWLALQQAAAMGLMPDGREGAMVIFGDDSEDEDGNRIASTANKKKMVQFMPMVRGLVQLVLNTGLVANIRCSVVYKGETFKWKDEGGRLSYSHERDFSAAIDEGFDNIIGAYAVIQFKDDSWMMEPMSRRQIDRRRAVSRAKKGPWVPWYDEMAKKTVLRHLIKLAPQSKQLAAVEAVLDADPYISGEVEELPDAAPRPAQIERAAPPVDLGLDRSEPEPEPAQVEREQPRQEQARREAPKAQPAASPPPAAAAPPPPAEPAAFAVYATDQTGEPIANEDGEPLEFATPIAFAEWFARAAELVTNFEAFMENNADAIGDCRDDRAAAELISAALNAARDRLAGMRSPDAEPQEVNPLLVPVGKTPKGSPHWPNYFSDAKAAVASIADVIGLDAWVEVNRASWEAHPVATLKLEKIIADRRDAIAPQAAEPTPAERRTLFSRRLLADFQLCTTADDMRALARNPMVIRMMAEIQEHEPETWAELDAAGATRMAELKS